MREKNIFKLSSNSLKFIIKIILLIYLDKYNIMQKMLNLKLFYNIYII